MPKGRPKKTKDKPLKKIKQEKVPLKKRGRPKKVIETPPVEKAPKEKDTESKKEPVVLTQEDMEIRREKIRATIPKIDLHRTKETFDLVKDKELCKNYTIFSCHRPDIYLDLGCVECALQKNCACPLKDINRRPEDKRPKFRKFTSAKKSS
jgi:hypothetical protein